MIRKAQRRKPMLVGPAISLSLLATACGSDSSSSKDTPAASAARPRRDHGNDRRGGPWIDAIGRPTCVDGDTVELRLLDSTSA